MLHSVPSPRSYLWLTIVYNVTYTVALYGLLLFYLVSASSRIVMRCRWQADSASFAAGRSMILRSTASSTLHSGTSAQRQQNHHSPSHYPRGHAGAAGSLQARDAVQQITLMHLFPSNSPPLQGTHELLAPFKPLLKFALVKAVIFLSYWQGLFISIATGAGAIPTSERVVLSWSCRFCC